MGTTEFNFYVNRKIAALKLLKRVVGSEGGYKLKLSADLPLKKFKALSVSMMFWGSSSGISKYEQSNLL